MCTKALLSCIALAAAGPARASGTVDATATTLLADLYASERDNAVPQLDAEGRKEMLQVIDEEADRLDRFVEGLTKLARIDAGEMHLQRQWTPIDEIIALALKRAEPRTRSHRMEVWIKEECEGQPMMCPQIPHAVRRR